MPDQVITIKVEFDAESQQRMLKLAQLPDQLPQAIRRGMDAGLKYVSGRLMQHRLGGHGPYPVEEHRLGERTGLLKQSVYTEPSVVQGNKVIGAIGASTFYSVVHEYGKKIDAVYGKFGATKELEPMLIFKIGDRWIRKKSVTIPARAPFTTELQSPESARLISDAINAEIQAAWSKL